MGSSSSSRIAIVIAALLCLAGCSSVPGLSAARNADFPSLRKTLKKEHLSPGKVRRIAREALSAEIVRAKDREDRPFIQSLRACSSSLFGALEKRSEKSDGVGAEAALLLLEAGRFPSVGKYREAEDGAWRALAARASKNDDEARRAYFTDPDERVRRTALQAAIEAGDPDDVNELLEVSRLDPDPLARSLAFSALAKIGGDEVSQALRDRFEVADEEVRLAIVDAWSRPALFDAGGRDQLRRLLTRESGFDALHAARILSHDADETTRNLALERLVRFSKDGSQEERRMALRFLPSHERVTVERLVELSKAEDEQVALIAWARLLGNTKYHESAQKALFGWADSDAPVAFQARAALAAGGDERVKPLMVEQMNSPLPENRKVAGYALIRLGAFGEMAPLLADEDETVRRDLACRTLARPYLTQNGEK